MGTQSKYNYKQFNRQNCKLINVTKSKGGKMFDP